ncbi:hypothetical protein GE09DRAFT_232484 [Coniochaeta sp. 2T2.1]|nr:hypothetical protein GE09DRAFT_232484 [Coniochaeta sp. 2T2.1]
MVLQFSISLTYFPPSLYLRVYSSSPYTPFFHSPECSASFSLTRTPSILPLPRLSTRPGRVRPLTLRQCADVMLLLERLLLRLDVLLHLLRHAHQILCAVVTSIMLPNTLATARFLTEEEREHCISRLSGVEHGTGSKEASLLTSVILAIGVSGRTAEAISSSAVDRVSLTPFQKIWASDGLRGRACASVSMKDEDDWCFSSVDSSRFCSFFFSVTVSEVVLLQSSASTHCDSSLRSTSAAVAASPSFDTAVLASTPFLAMALGSLLLAVEEEGRPKTAPRRLSRLLGVALVVLLAFSSGFLAVGRLLGVLVVLGVGSGFLPVGGRLLGALVRLALASGFLPGVGRLLGVLVVLPLASGFLAVGRPVPRSSVDVDCRWFVAVAVGRLFAALLFFALSILTGVEMKEANGMRCAGPSAVLYK